MINTIIFDFDGTLANTLEPGLAIVNQLADKFGYKKLSPEDVKRLQGQLPREILREVGITLWKLPLVARAVRKQLTGQMSAVRFYPGVREVLGSLKSKGVPLGILTSGSKENVQIFLRQNQAEDKFDFIFAESNLFGKGRVLRKLLKTYKIAFQAAVYVGDEIRDIEAARTAGIKVASVTWGVNTREILRTLKPDWLIEKPEELLQIIE